MRNGVAPSRVHLPPGPWARLLDFLLERFRHIPPDILRVRLARGDIVDDAGMPQTLDSPYRPLRWLWYYREVPAEAPVPFELSLLFRDSRLVVVDKPHFLASIPGGRYLAETALTRLRDQLDLPLLSPIHRLDRDTAGVLLFCADPDSRGAYQALFQARDVRKEYEAIAPLLSGLVLPLVHRSRLEARAGHFTMHEVAGEPNSETRIELVGPVPGPGAGPVQGCCDSTLAASAAAPRASLGHYRLRPHTGRKHQLRVHMSALGLPICNDNFYPDLKAYADADDFGRPLQLLARAIEFTDPFSGRQRRFESRRQLSGLQAQDQH